VRGKLLRRYPFFYIYAASIFVCDVLLFVTYKWNPAAYPAWCWGTEFLNILLGCGIILEIFQHVLAPYPGAERLARITGVAVFAAILCLAIFHPMAPGAVQGGSAYVSLKKYVPLERNLLTVQALLFFAVLAVISYYRTSMGRNVKGMILGYGFWLGSSIMTLELWSFIGPRFNVELNVIQPAAYLTALLIWVGALWARDPDPAFGPPTAPEMDHEAVLASTRSAMEAMRSHLSKAARA